MRSRHCSHISQKCAYRIFFRINCHFLCFHMRVLCEYANGAQFRTFSPHIASRYGPRIFKKNCNTKPACLIGESLIITGRLPTVCCMDECLLLFLVYDTFQCLLCLSSLLLWILFHVDCSSFPLSSVASCATY